MLMIPSILSADVFVDWRAGYHVTYPDDWYHVPYSDVSIFLIEQNITPAEFDYDAVLARKTEGEFHSGPYIFLTFQPVGQLKDKQIDSVLKFISNEYGLSHNEEPITAPGMVFGLSRPVYDKSLNAVAVKTRVTSEFTDKYVLEMWKFYEKGIALFLCYASKEMYNDAQPIFINIFKSFSTKDLDKVAPRDSAKIVDASERTMPSSYGDDSSIPGGEKGLSESTRRALFVVLLLVIMAVLLRVFIFKKKKTVGE